MLYICIDTLPQNSDLIVYIVYINACLIVYINMTCLELVPQFLDIDCSRFDCSHFDCVVTS